MEYLPLIAFGALLLWVLWRFCARVFDLGAWLFRRQGSLSLGQDIAVKAAIVLAFVLLATGVFSEGFYQTVDGGSLQIGVPDAALLGALLVGAGVSGAFFAVSSARNWALKNRNIIALAIFLLCFFIMPFGFKALNGALAKRNPRTHTVKVIKRETSRGKAKSHYLYVSDFANKKGTRRLVVEPLIYNAKRQGSAVKVTVATGALGWDFIADVK